ncbi:MAG: O-antigen ligase family protein [Pirellulaceae bacterium]
MAVLAFTIGLALAVWSVIALLRGSVFLSTALFLIATTTFPAEFFAVDAVGLTWTLDRFWFLALVSQVAVRWYRGEQDISRFETTDLAIGCFLLWLIARTITQPLGATLPGMPPTLMHFVNGYLIPFTLYFCLRTSKLDPKLLRPALLAIILLGVYLAVTAVFELLKLWGLVYPRFISDPSIGIHFGRARGPMLQSVRLGVALLACWVPFAVYSVWLRPMSRISWATFLAGMPLACGAIFCTYTRSIWMGLAFVVGLLVLLCLNGLPRRAALFGMFACVLVVGLVKGPDLVAFKREYSAAETRESTYMRAAFAYVSIEMFKDRPVTGFGFNQFQVYNRPYLADRSTNIRLESIRGYVHHNSYLSLLVDLGIIGFTLYGLVLMCCTREAWRLWQATAVPKWVRGIGLCALALTGVHLIQMAFHEVSFSTIENGFLFASYGLTVAARRQFCFRENPMSVQA